jgi:hypothetical protein
LGYDNRYTVKLEPGVPSKFGVLLVVLTMILANGCAMVRIRTDYSHYTDFGRYHTYSWLKVGAGNTAWADSIRRDVNAQLAARGWTEAPSGGQTAVAAFGPTREQPTLATFYSSFGPSFGDWHWRGWNLEDGMEAREPVETPVGSLVVDIFDGSSKQLLWRGVAREVLSGTAGSNDQKLVQAVAAIFKNFPPPFRGYMARSGDGRQPEQGEPGLN